VKAKLALFIAAWISLFLLPTVMAQKKGFQLGLSTGSVSLSHLGSGFEGPLEGKNILGVEAGFFIEPGFGPFFIRPSVLYDYRYGTVNYIKQDPESWSPQSGDFEVHKLKVPLVFGIRLLGPLTVEGGPVYHYIFSATNTYSETEFDIFPHGLGYRVGLGINLSRFWVDLHYEGVNFYYKTGKPRFSEPNKLVFGLGVTLGR
jgi:hypothetical protein